MFKKGLILIVLLALLGLSYWQLSSEQALVKAASPQPQDIAKAEQALSRSYQSLYNDGDAHFWFQADELNAVATLASHALPNVNFEFKLHSQRLQLQASVALPERLPRPYLNLHITIAQAVQLESVRLGQWQLNGKWLQWLLLLWFDCWHPEWNASGWYHWLQQLPQQYSDQQLSLNMDRSTKHKLMQHVQAMRGERLPVAERERMLHYYQLLQQQQQAFFGQGSRSLADYLQPLCDEVLSRSQRASITQESQAMAWALVVFFSDGMVQQVLAQRFQPELHINTAPTNVNLAGRHDLHLHFIYSAAMVLISEPYLSEAVGEFKELHDSLAGGSGFSFADLAADKTGVFFAKSLSSARSAKTLLQAISKDGSEQSFFPYVGDLPEGYSHSEFAYLYTDIYSEAYVALMADIEQRIADLAAY